jgi:hypothetical protein
MDTADVPAAEARLRAEAQRVAAGLQVEADRVEQQRAANVAPPADAYADEPGPRYDGTR